MLIVYKNRQYSILINFYVIVMSLVMVPICSLETRTHFRRLDEFRKSPWSLF